MRRRRIAALLLAAGLGAGVLAGCSDDGAEVRNLDGEGSESGSGSGSGTEETSPAG
jgi:hypothetical protein